MSWNVPESGFLLGKAEARSSQAPCPGVSGWEAELMLEEFDSTWLEAEIEDESWLFAELSLENEEISAWEQETRISKDKGNKIRRFIL